MNPTPVPGVWPILHYDDTRRALRFLVDVVGFDEVIAVAGSHDEIVHAELSWQGNGCVVFGSTQHTDSVHGSMQSGTSAVYLVTDQVDEIHDRVRRSTEGRVVQPPAATQFGSGAAAYAFTVADPENNLWTFGTYAGVSQG